MGNLSGFSQSMNNIVLWGSGGYNSFMTSSENVFTKGNMGFDAGIGYELHYKRLLFQTGAEFGYYNARLGLNDFIQRRDLVDTEGYSYVGNFAFTENIDKYSYGNINIPVMIGMQNRFLYFMVGGKVGINMMGKSIVTNTLKSSGTYDDRYNDDLFDDNVAGEMLNHDFGTFNQQQEYSIDFNINFSLSAEIGTYIGPAYKDSGKPKYRLAVYADYGLLDIHNKSKKADLILNNREEPFFFPKLNSYLQANPTVDKKVNPLYIGLKFTVIFQISDKKECTCEEFLAPGSKRLWGVLWGGY